MAQSKAQADKQAYSFACYYVQARRHLLYYILQKAVAARRKAACLPSSCCGAQARQAALHRGEAAPSLTAPVQAPLKGPWCWAGREGQSWGEGGQEMAENSRALSSHTARWLGVPSQAERWHCQRGGAGRLQSQEGSGISPMLRRAPIILVVTRVSIELDGAYWHTALGSLAAPAALMRGGNPQSCNFV